MRTPTCQKGAAVVEFALLALLLLVFVFGIIEFGLIWLQSHYIANAAREGSRVASKIAEVKDSTLDNVDDVRDAAEGAIIAYLSGAVVYSADMFINDPDLGEEQNCCNSTDFLYVADPVVEAIPETDNYTLRVSITVKTAEIWNPVLWPLLDILPGGGGVGTIEQVTEEAVFPIIK